MEKSLTLDLTKKYQLKCLDEKELISTRENLFKLQGKILIVNNDSLRTALIKNSTITPILLIKKNVCTVCFDALLLELENMRSDSLPLIKNLIAVEWSEYKKTNRKGVINVFKSKNNAVFSIGRDELNILRESSFPDMCIILINDELRIVSTCEFSTNYTLLFSKELAFLNTNYFVNNDYH